MASREPRVTDAAAFDQLRLDLVAAGFEPIEGRVGWWEGPLFDCFQPLVPGVDRMQIWIKDGFPHTLPKIFVKGMPGEHVSAAGDVCLWTGTDETYTWRRLAEIEDRAAEWVERQRVGFSGPDAVLDAHLYFECCSPSQIAAFELDSVSAAGEATIEVSGTLDGDGNILTIAPDGSGDIPGRCYSIPSAPPAPPRTLDQFREALTPGQRRNFDRRLRAVKKGENAVLMLSWSAGQERNVLVLLVTPETEGSARAEAIEAAPTDRRFQLLRAGPDAGALEAMRAVLFGVGAVGSHAVLMLGSSGFGRLRLVDGGTIRPGDRARHASGGMWLGKSKASAMSAYLYGRAPWTEVETICSSPWEPEQVRELIEDADVVVELTGYGRFTDLLSLIAAEADRPLVSGALHRRGAIGRARCQIAGRPLIAERIDPTRYPIIPPDEEVPQAFEPGCSEPVNNASPIRVERLAGLVADLAIDVALGREVPDEVVEVYEPIDNSPFDRRGRLEFPT